MNLQLRLQPSVRDASRAQYIVRYVGAVVLVLVAAFLQMLLRPQIGHHNPFLLFASAIMVSAWMGGLRAGLIATVSAVTVAMITAEDTFETSHLLGVIFFAAEGILISTLVYRLRLSRRHSFEALKVNQERFRLALEAAKISVYGNDASLRYTWVHNAHPDFPSETLIGKRDDDLLPAEAVADLMALKREVLATGASKQRQIVTTINDVPHSFLVSAEPTYSAAGAVNGLTVATVDITEMTQMQAALRDTEEKLRVALKNSAITVAQVDRDLRYTWLYNPHPAFKADVSIGQRYEDLHPGEGAERLTALKRRALETGESLRERITFRFHEDTATFEITAEPLCDEQGDIIGLTTAAVDVTENERTLARLRESEKVRRLALEAAGMGTWITDIINQSVTWDQQARRIFGVGETEEVTLEDGFSVIHPDDVPRAKAIFEEAIDPASEMNYENEKRVIWPDGSVHWVYTIGSVVREEIDGEMRPARLVGVVMDITERRQIQEQLLESARRLQLAKEAAGLGTFDYNIPANRIDWDQRTRQLWGVGPHEAITYETFLSGVHPEDWETTEAAVNRAISDTERGAFTAEYRVINRVDGVTRWIGALGRVAFENGKARRLVGTVQDITDRKRVQAQLQFAAEQYRTLADSMPQLVWTANSQGIVDYYNVRTAEYRGIEQRPDGTWVWQAVVHPDDSQRTFEAWREAVRKRERYECEHRIQMADGSYRWHISRAIPVQHTAQDAIQWYGTATDIHQQKLTEEALRESEERFRNMADHAPVMVWVSDASGACTYMSQSWYAFCGQAPGEALGDGWLKIVHPEDREWTQKAFLAANEKEQPFHFEYRLWHHSGQYRWAVVSANPRHSPGGDFLGFIGSVLDFTERKQQEEALRQQRETLQQLVDSLPVMITIYEPDTQVLYLNREFERLIGWHTHELVEVDLMTVVYPDPEYREMVREYMQSLEPGWRDFDVTARDGSIVPSSWANIRLPDGRQVGIGVDIRERLRAEERSRLLQTVAAQLSGAMTETGLTEVVVEHGIRALGADAGTIAILSPDETALQIVGTVGYPDWVVDKWRIIPLDHPTAPVALAVRERRPLWLGNPEERIRAIPMSAHLAPEETHSAWAVLPFAIGADAVGVIGLGFNQPQAFHQSDRDFLTTLADYFGHALERVRLTEHIRHLAAIEERQRLSRDLHDAVKQLIFASSVMAQNLPALWERTPERARKVTQQVDTLNRAALAEMEALLLAMRPEAIMKTPFDALLENLCAGLRGKKRIQINMELNGLKELHLPGDVHVAFYRIAQEAITNVAKHSDAACLNVTGDYDGTALMLEIEDDGQGFDVPDAQSGFGLSNMRERAAAVGATFDVRSAPGDGTVIRVGWQPEETPADEASRRG